MFFFCNTCEQSFLDIMEMKIHEKDCDTTDERLENKPFSLSLFLKKIDICDCVDRVSR